MSDLPGDEPHFISRQVTQARRFYLDLKPRADTALSVVCGGWERCARDYRVERADFPFYSVEWVVSGEGTLGLGGADYSLEPGSLFSYGPGIAQRIATHPRKTLSKYFVDFAGPRASTLLREAGLSPGSYCRSSSGALKPLFDVLIAVSLGTQAQRSACLQLEVLLLNARPNREPSTRDNSLAFATYERCKAHIDEHFVALATLEEAALACRLDSSYLCRLFQRFARQSPYQYLLRLKMAWAADRLRDGRLLVREIADALMIDPFQFSRSFKRVHGLSPAAFAGRYRSRWPKRAAMVTAPLTRPVARACVSPQDSP